MKTIIMISFLMLSACVQEEDSRQIIIISKPEQKNHAHPTEKPRGALYIEESQ
jgi:hypothetical protein